MFITALKKPANTDEAAISKTYDVEIRVVKLGQKLYCVERPIHLTKIRVSLGGSFASTLKLA